MMDESIYMKSSDRTMDIADECRMVGTIGEE